MPLIYVNVVVDKGNCSLKVNIIYCIYPSFCVDHRPKTCITVMSRSFTTQRAGCVASASLLKTMVGFVTLRRPSHSSRFHVGAIPAAL